MAVAAEVIEALLRGADGCGPAHEREREHHVRAASRDIGRHERAAVQAGDLADHGQAIAGAPARVADGDEAVAVEQRAEHALREALARIRHADEQRLLAPLKAQADLAARRLL